MYRIDTKKPAFVVGQVVTSQWVGTVLRVAAVFHNRITGDSRYRVEGLDGRETGYFDEEDLQALTLAEEPPAMPVPRLKIIPGSSAEDFLKVKVGTIIRSLDDEKVELVFITGGGVNIPYYISLRFGTIWTVFDLAKRSAAGEAFEVVGGLFDT